MTTRVLRPAAALLLTVLVGCERSGPSSSVVSVERDDPAMKAAIELAAATLTDFVEVFQNQSALDHDFAIKKGFPASDRNHEFIWITPESWDGDSFTGTIANDPVDVEGLSYGDRVTVRGHEVADWMYVRNTTLHGAYTLRVIFEQQHGDAWQAVREIFGWELADEP